MKKLLLRTLMIVMVLCLVLSGCGGGGDQASDNEDNTAVDDTVYTMRLGHVVATDHPSHIALETFKKNVEERSGGRLIVELYPNATLGGDRQVAEAVSLGTVEATVAGADSVSGMIKEWGLVGSPYLFTSYDSVIAALDGDFGAKLAELGETQSLHVLGWGGSGFRNVSNSLKDISTPEDMKGLKIRVMENPTHIALFKALGANPTPIAFNELFTALQQKTVDAQENPLTTFTTSKFYEVQKHMTLTEHVYTAAPFFINKGFFDSLPQDLQDIVTKAGEEWTVEQRQLIVDNEAKYLQTCKDGGMTVIELTPEQKQAFIDMAQVVYDDLYKEYGTEIFDMARKYNQ